MLLQLVRIIIIPVTVVWFPMSAPLKYWVHKSSLCLHFIIVFFLFSPCYYDSCTLVEFISLEDRICSWHLLEGSTRSSNSVHGEAIQNSTSQTTSSCQHGTHQTPFIQSVVVPKSNYILHKKVPRYSMQR